MTLRWPLIALILCAPACSKDKDSKPAETAPKEAAPDPDADLIDHTWAGKMHSSAGELKFKRDGEALAAEWAFQLFGRVIITDEYSVTRAPDGTITLKGKPENRLIGGGRFPLNELVGKLSDDKKTIAGKHTIPQGDIEWFITTTKKVGELDPPLDVAAGQKALTAGAWEGTIGDKPAKLTFTEKDGKTTGVIVSGKDKTTVDATVAGDGKVTMTAVPKPTPQGLKEETFVGYFGTNELLKISGTRDEVVKEGFVEQANSGAFTFERKVAAAKPAGKGGKAAKPAKPTK